jgi:hypothetical protein
MSQCEDRWDLFHSPEEKDDPPFCHECSYSFIEGEEVFINLFLGRMLCGICFGKMAYVPSAHS